MSIALWLVMRTRGMFALCSMSGMMFKCRYELHRSWGLFQLVMATNCMAVLVLISELVVVTGYGHQGDYGDLMTRISLQINSLSKPVILVVFNEQFRRKLRRLIRRPHIAPAPTIPSIELPDDLAMGQTEVSRVKVPRSATTQRRITLTVQQDITPSDQQTRRSSKISLQIAGNQSNSGGMILTVNQGNLRRKSAGDIDCLRTDTEEDCSRRVSVTFYDDHSRRLSMDAGIRRYSTHEVTGNIVCENEVDLDLTSVGNKKTEDMDSPFFEAAGDVNGEEKGATEVQEKSTTIGPEQAEEPTETNSSGIQVQVQFNDDQVVTEDLPLGIRKSRSQRRSFAGRRNSTYSDLSSMLGHRNSLSSICTQAYPNSYPLADWTTRRRSQNSISQLPQLRSRAWTSKRGGDCYGLPGAVETPPVTRRGSALACQMRSTCLSSASSSSPSTTSSFGIPLYRRPSQRYTQNPGFHQVRESEESLVEESNMSTMTNWGALNSRSDTGSLRVHRRGRLSLSSLSVGSMSSNDAEYDVIDEPSGVYLGVCGTKKMKKLAASCSSIWHPHGGQISPSQYRFDVDDRSVPIACHLSTASLHSSETKVDCLKFNAFKCCVGWNIETWMAEVLQTTFPSAIS